MTLIARPRRHTAIRNMALARHCALYCALCIAVLFLPVETRADEVMPREIAAWFDALRNNDKQAIGALLADDAVIELKDLSINQSATEFVESLDQWAELNGGAEIHTRATRVDATTVETEVCYRFETNEVLNRETFTLGEGRITGSVQEQLAESCEDL